MPNGCPDGQNVFYVDGDQYKYATFFLEEFIPHVESKFHGNGKRAIAGLSLGGFGTLYHCLLHPEKWTYAYAMSPATWWMDDMMKGPRNLSIRIIFRGFTHRRWEKLTPVCEWGVFTHRGRE